MPRPKPTYEQLRDNFFPDVPHLRPSDDEDWKINTNYNFTALCLEDRSPDKGKLIFDVIPDVGVKHLYKISANYIKMGKMDPNVCPYCYTERNKKETGISFKILDEYVRKYDMEIINKKDFYSRYEDSLIVKCKKGHTFEVKSLFYRENNNYETEIVCDECVNFDNDEKLKKFQIDNGLMESDDFEKKLGKLKYIVKINDFVVPVPIINKPMSEGAIKALSDGKWLLKEYNGTKEKSLFICSVCGAEKSTYVLNLKIRGGNCDNCRKMGLRNQIYSKMIDKCRENSVFPVEDVPYVDIRKPIKFKCNKCGEEFETMWHYINTSDARICCPKCYKSTKRKTQNEIYDWVCSLVDTKVEQEDKSNGFELDIFIPERKIGIEYCGLIWHSTKWFMDNWLKEKKDGMDFAVERRKFIKKHLNKMKDCSSKDIRLLTIFEDEWVEKRDVCESRIKNCLGLIKDKRYARNLELRETDSKTSLSFCENNHIQGRGQSHESFGLYEGDELVSVMTFSKPSISKHAEGYDWELNRFCSKKDVVIVGGASKLLSEFRKRHRGERLITFCDLRWNLGTVYEKIGFEFEKETDLGYYYVGKLTNWKRVHRYNYNKGKLLQLFPNSDLKKTEEQIAYDNGLYQIYDCGHLKYKMVC